MKSHASAEPVHAVNRRRHERFVLCPMYTSVGVQRVGERRVRRLAGHAYDISESGVRIELDEPLEAGEEVAVDLTLPGEDGDIVLSAQVVWVGDSDDDPGPRRSALLFGQFKSRADHERLLTFLGSGLCSRAA